MLGLDVLCAAYIQHLIRLDAFWDLNGQQILDIIGTVQQNGKLFGCRPGSSCLAAADRAMKHLVLDEVGELRVLRAGPESLVVLQLADDHRVEQIHRIAEALAAVTPQGSRSIVLAHGATISMLGEEELLALGLTRTVDAPMVH